MAKTGLLTDAAIKALKPKKVGGVLKAWERPDGGARGLYVFVGVSGQKSFVVRYRINGKPAKITLGPYLPGGKELVADPKVGDPLTLAAARMLAPATILQVGRGINPALVKRQDKEARHRAAANTFEGVALEYLRREAGMREHGGELHFDRNKLRGGAERYRVLKRQVFPTLGAMPITDIKKSDIVRLLDKIADGELKNDDGEVMKGGLVQADRTLALIRKILGWHAARSDDFRPPVLKGLIRVPQSEGARDRVLSDAEIRAIWKVSGEMKGAFAAFVRFLLMTAARRGEASLMRWDEISGNEWTLPRERNKVAARNSKVPELIRPLNAPARAVLDALPRVDGCPFVFTSDGKRALTGYSKPKITFDQAMLEALRQDDPKAKLQNWRLHDLRRTARTLMARAGVNDAVAEQALGHVLKGVAAVYNRHRYLDEMSKAYDALASLIESIVDDTTPAKRAGKVLQFAGAQR
jgi:integrase